jgi:hypothetical protein
MRLSAVEANGGLENVDLVGLGGLGGLGLDDPGLGGDLVLVCLPLSQGMIALTMASRIGPRHASILTGLIA